MSDDCCEEKVKVVQIAGNAAVASIQNRLACFTPSDAALPLEVLYEHFTHEDGAGEVSLGYTPNATYDAAEVVDLATYQGGGIVQADECPCFYSSFENLVDFTPALTAAIPATDQTPGRVQDDDTPIAWETSGVGTSDTHTVNMIGLRGQVVPVTITMTQINGAATPVTVATLSNTTQGGGRFFFANQPADMTVRVEVGNDCFGNPYNGRLRLNAGSIGGAEALVFSGEYPVVDFAQGAGGQNISGSLPFSGAWNNNNNNAQSGFEFAAGNVLEFQKNNSGSAGASVILSFRDVAEAVSYEACDVVDLAKGIVAAAPVEKSAVLDATDAPAPYALPAWEEGCCVDVNVVSNANGGAITAPDASVVGITDIDQVNDGAKLRACSTFERGFFADGNAVSGVQPNSAPNTVTVVLVPGVIELQRGANGGWFNVAQEAAWSGGVQISPIGTEWQNLIEPFDGTQDEWTTFTDSLDNAIGDNIVGAPNLYVRNAADPAQIWHVSVSAWQSGGGGGFTALFQPISEQAVQIWQVCQINAPDTNFFNTPLTFGEDGIDVIHTVEAAINSNTGETPDWAIVKPSDNPALPGYSFEWRFNGFVAMSREYLLSNQAQTALQNSFVYSEDAQGPSWTFVGPSAGFVLNEYDVGGQPYPTLGLPNQVVVSGGNLGRTSWGWGGIPKDVQFIDLTVAEPPLNDLNLLETLYYNTGTGPGSQSGAAYVPGLYAYRVEATGLTLDPYDLQLQDGVSIFCDDQGVMHQISNGQTFALIRTTNIPTAGQTLIGNADGTATWA